MRYWETIWAELKTILQYEIPKTSLVLYLGNISHENTPKEDQYLLKVLLAASKKTITRKWYKTEPPDLEQWMCIVEEIYVMEKMTFMLRLQETMFFKRWDKWIWYKIVKDDTTTTG